MFYSQADTNYGHVEDGQITYTHYFRASLYRLIKISLPVQTAHTFAS